MEAAHSLTVLKIGYKGAIRLVEPYSLAYKRRRDGVTQEYFYGWDQTGGQTSDPGIKTFLSPRVESIENTDIRFEPRFEVELKKAGEKPEKSYFGKPFGAGRTRRGISRPKRGRSARRMTYRGFGSDFTYIIQCPVCGKEFRRKKMSTKLNKHKDKYGNPCYGRSGYIARQTF